MRPCPCPHDSWRRIQCRPAGHRFACAPNWPFDRPYSGRTTETAWWPAVLILCWFLASGSAPAADRFGDILVAPQTAIAGETFYGYLEHRVLVSNESDSRAHTVTVVYPAESGPYGERLERLQRTVRLGPGATAHLILWQPPVPAYGAGYAVYVDGRIGGKLAPMTYTKHAQPGRGYHGSEIQRTLLISRSLNPDAVQNAFALVFGEPCSPAKAIGAPDGERSIAANAWLPDETEGTASAPWLELDYTPALPAHRIRIYELMSSSSRLHSVVLYATNGVELETFLGPFGGRRYYNYLEIPFNLTREPVGRIRLSYEPAGSGAAPTAVDAVQLIGPGKTAWASQARASSYLKSGPGVMPSSIARRYGLMGPGLRQTAINLVRSELEPAQWSAQWLAYTPFDAIWLTDRDYAAMPEAVRITLWRFAEAGGCLVVMGSILEPDPWRRFEFEHGPGANGRPIGFGYLLTFNTSEITELGPAQMKLIADAARASAWPRVFPQPSDLGAANAQFPVIANVKIPFRSMVLILFAFVLIIGPVNLIWLARIKKRIWSLWTIPVISFVTCGIVFLYSFFSEGITPHVRAESVTVLDQVNHRATTLGLLAFYCPLTPRQGLQFSYDTELTPVLAPDAIRQGWGRELDWTQSQHLQRGWLASRVPAYFHLRKSESRRERLQVELEADGQLAVVNGLGTTIVALRLTDAAGRTYAVTNIAAGQRIQLATDLVIPAQPVDTAWLQDYYRRSGWGSVDSFWQKMQNAAPPPDAYIALLSGTPFLEPGLSGPALSERSSVVIGLLDRQEEAP